MSTIAKLSLVSESSHAGLQPKCAFGDSISSSLKGESLINSGSVILYRNRVFTFITHLREKQRYINSFLLQRNSLHWWICLEMKAPSILIQLENIS